jgi:hypothetical protein
MCKLTLESLDKRERIRRIYVLEVGSPVLEINTIDYTGIIILSYCEGSEQPE